MAIDCTGVEMSKLIVEESREFARKRLPLLLLTPYPLAVIALLEAARLPWEQFVEHFSVVPLAVQTWGRYSLATTEFLADLLVIQFIVFALAFVVRRRHLVVGMVCATGAGVSNWIVYGHLTTYPPFAGYPPFVAGLVAFALGLAACMYLACTRDLPERFGAGALVAGGTLVVGAALLVAHHTVFPGRYPALHLSLVALSFLAMTWGLYAVGNIGGRHLVQAFPKAVPTVVVVTAVVVIGGLVGMIGSTASMPEEVDSFLASQSELEEDRLTADGRGRVEVDADECSEFDEELAMDEAVETFFEQTGYVRLDGELSLEEMNVLLVKIEAVRFDETDLQVGTSSGTTPNLADLAARGGINFTDAHAPSSNTLHSGAGLMAMTQPALAPVTFDAHRNSRGELRDETRRVAEYFAESGYETFKFVHHALGDERRGFDRGFATDFVVDEEDVRDDYADEDELITDEFLAFMQERSGRDEPFFGWLYYWSPHAPYVARSDDGDTDARSRYRQEIEHADAQVGRVVDRLEADGLLDETIIVVTSDHGEEFGEHGGTKHGSELYRESIHVPLLVYIPGVEPRTVDAAVSASYVFSWLFLHAESTMRDGAVEHLGESVVPALEASDGGAVSELLNRRGGKMALTDDDYKIVHDLETGHTEVFDRRSDPYEQWNLILEETDGVERMLERLQGYLRYRACNREFEGVK